MSGEIYESHELNNRTFESNSYDIQARPLENLSKEVTNASKELFTAKNNINNSTIDIDERSRLYSIIDSADSKIKSFDNAKNLESKIKNNNKAIGDLEIKIEDLKKQISEKSDAREKALKSNDFNTSATLQNEIDILVKQKKNALIQQDHLSTDNYKFKQELKNATINVDLLNRDVNFIKDRISILNKKH